MKKTAVIEFEYNHGKEDPHEIFGVDSGVMERMLFNLKDSGNGKMSEDLVLLTENPEFTGGMLMMLAYVGLNQLHPRTFAKGMIMKMLGDLTGDDNAE